MKYSLLETEPARLFDDAHLLGNGSLGASVFGGVPCERVLINCDTLWSGQESSKISESTLPNLARARALVLDGRLKEANDLIDDDMLGYWSEAYMPLGNLYLTIGHATDLRTMRQKRALINASPFTGYSRTLSLDEAVERIQYDQAGVRYTRELLVSSPDRVLAVRLSAEGGPLEFSIGMDSPLRHTVRIDGEATCMSGRAPDRVECYYPAFAPRVSYLPDQESNSVRFSAVCRVADTDGTVCRDRLRVYVSGASYAVVLLSAHTNYAGYKQPRERDHGPLVERCAATVADAGGRGWRELRRAHVADHAGLYGRVDIDLGEPLTGHLATSRRLDLAATAVDDPSLWALAMQYSRYLLISFSRPGTQAGNLQGLWNPEPNPPWACNYTININAQMNYWGAETLGLPECHLPLVDLVRDLSDSGREAARALYGANGWVAHHNTDLWRMATLAGEDASWAWWPFGGVWLCQHLWTHWEFTRDRAFLEDTLFPILKGAVEFLLDYTVKDRDGFTVTSPSTSPENRFFVPGADASDEVARISQDNRYTNVQAGVAAVCKASTMDLALVREIMGNFHEAERLLGITSGIDARVEETLRTLLPFRVGRHGQLQEWDEDYQECTPGMSHVSHLYGLYPGSVITPESPAPFQAARLSALRRSRHGSLARQWSGAWGVCLYARLGDGESCNRIGPTMAGSLGSNLLAKNNWQIDGIMGWGAGVAEMLLQSHDGSLHLLPAPSPSWVTGSVRGLRARGGFTVDIRWEKGRLTEAVIRARHAGLCRVRYAGLVAEVDVPEAGSVTLDGRLKPARR